MQLNEMIKDILKSQVDPDNLQSLTDKICTEVIRWILEMYKEHKDDEVKEDPDIIVKKLLNLTGVKDDTRTIKK